MKGRKEGFRIRATKDILCIYGTDGHGMAYGLLEVSRLMGISPWEWWADALPRPLERFSLPSGFKTEQAPDVEFRGIFINDEDWGLTPWASKDEAVKGTIGPSHCEPMACNVNEEWRRRENGSYDYVHNSDAVCHFWEERVREVAGQPVLYTLGMRGVHDGAMQGAQTVDEQKAVLERVISDQRKLLAKHVNPDVTHVPQVFIPYKEVLSVYDAGLEIPEDVCLMWCDDNYGYIRHFPTEKERSRQGGNGVCYHVSYWGRQK